DWKAEVEFLLNCFERYAQLPVRNVYEPACGTGRLMVKLAEEGLGDVGSELNPHAVDYCNQRLERAGFPPTAVVGDMCDFRPSKPVEAAFNTINSFRHLATQGQAERHLRSVAASLRPGGIYVLGLHLTP